jgi:RNA-directed DNA polymerase
MLERTKNNSSLLLLEDCEELRKKFLELKHPRELATLLGVTYERLIYHIYGVSDEQKYIEFTILKKSGQTRTISAPATALKIIQRKLSQILYSVYDPKASVHGFIPSRSILTNAKPHLRKRFILNIDLKDFFDSIHFGRVRGIFMAPPYNLPEDVATVLAQICCFSNKLPQGAPTSPVVSNMICARLDSQLRLLSKEAKCTFTRYADDITFSTSFPIFPKKLAYIDTDDKSNEYKVFLGNRLVSIVQDNGFRINWEKVRLQHKSHHQEVTGITVNQFPNVKREFVRKISMMLHVWQKFGLESAQKKYKKIKSKELNIPEEDVPRFQDVLRGKINFLGMIRGKKDSLYLKYLNWYCLLSERQRRLDGQVAPIQI